MFIAHHKSNCRLMSIDVNSTRLTLPYLRSIHYELCISITGSTVMPPLGQNNNGWMMSWHFLLVNMKSFTKSCWLLHNSQKKVLLWCNRFWFLIHFLWHLTVATENGKLDPGCKNSSMSSRDFKHKWLKHSECPATAVMSHSFNRIHPRFATKTKGW